MEWPTFKPTDTPIDALVALSHYYGADPQFVLGGGGNTSVKTDQRLYVKGSGWSLATIRAEGFVEMDRAALEAILSRSFSTDRLVREQQFKDAVMAARAAPEKNQRPSVECVLHHLLPRRFIVHTHSCVANAFTCCVHGEKLIAELLGEDALWIADVDPGLVLSQTLRDALKGYFKKTGRDCPRAILMQNHGLVVAGDSPEEVRGNTDWVISALRARLAKASGDEPFGPVTKMDAADGRLLIGMIAPALRGLLGEADALKVVRFDDSPVVMGLVGGSEGGAAALGGPMTPDQIVYCKSAPIWFDPGSQRDPRELVDHLRRAVETYETSTSLHPLIILVKGLGQFAVGDDFASAETAQLVYRDAIEVMAGAKRLGGMRPLRVGQREFFEKWEVEQYRRQVSKGNAGSGRMAGKVAVVTGAAQGFGWGIAQDLVAQGAHVVLLDVNVEGARKAAGQLVSRHGRGRALGLGADVTNGPSVADALHQVVRTYGGFDVLISNAGVLRAGSVKSQSEKDFDLVTAVNYKGYFVCVQQASPILSIQRLARLGYWSDIIQINSKSGLQGSNRNFAYAGSKFGGVGLTQSFAMELIEDGVKVNAICPGNLFDGPLWSDPVNGLFVQYLRSGKVPGAKTVEDVRRAYESKVPMGRGCTAADVVKAVYYLIEQKYETGQALPVTGGQIMLS